MTFWNALWKNDHAITYLAEKHLTIAPRKALNSLPKWVKGLGALVLGLLALQMMALSLMLLFTEEPLSALAPVLFVGCQVTMFYGLYRTWTLASLLSKLRESDALPTFLHTSVRVEETIDVLAGRALRQVGLFVGLPMGTVFVGMSYFMTTTLKATPPDWRFAAPMVLLLLYYALLGVFAILVMHAAGSGPRGLGRGFLYCLGYLYGPTLGFALLAAVIPAAEIVVGICLVLYVLGLPLIFRSMAIRFLNSQAGAQGPLRSLGRRVARLTSVLPRFSNTSLFEELADRNPMLTRHLSKQSLLVPLAACTVIFFLSSQMMGPFELHADGAGSPSWFKVHIVGWLTAVGLSCCTFAYTNSAVSQEKRSRTLEVLRTTLLSARGVVDGWAVGAFWAYLVLAVPLVLWLLPGRYDCLALVMAVPVCAAYGGIAMGLKDPKGTGLTVVIGILIFLSWVLLPGAFMAGFLHPQGALAAVVALAAWALRRRAIIAYRR
jgi:hypothetical protein